MGSVLIGVLQVSESSVREPFAAIDTIWQDALGVLRLFPMIMNADVNKSRGPCLNLFCPFCVM